MLLPADADLVRREHAITGLASLLDPDEFVAMLHQAVPRSETVTAKPVYVRYKPGRSCLATYKVSVGGEIIDVYAKALPRDGMEELGEAGQQLKVPGRLGPGVFILEERGIGIFIFPNDSHLKALTRLFDSEAQMRLLKELIPERPDLWGSTVEGIRYKPERRFSARLLTWGQPRAVLKVYNSLDYSAAERNAGAFRSRGPLRLARRLGCASRHNILVFDWLEGRLLSEKLLQPELDLEPVRTVGAAIAELHAQDPGRLTRLTRDQEAATLLAASAELGFLCPHLARRADDVARELAIRIKSNPNPECPTHGDFKSEQILVEGNAVAILDYDRAVSGDPSADLGKFLANLEKFTLRGNLPRTKLEAVKNALLEGYQHAARSDIPARIELYTAAVLLQIARRRFRHRKLDWVEVTEAILERAEDILKTDTRGKFTYRLQGTAANRNTREDGTHAATG